MLLVWVGLLGCGPSVPAITGGDYQFATVAVEDACLDGALDALFMPGGSGVEQAFEFPIFVPSPDQTPMSYAIDLRAPFLGMPVEVTTTEEGLAVRGGEMPAVLLGEAAYGDCVATMRADVDLWPAGAGMLGGEARLSVSSPRGDEGRCPVFAADPCQVTLQVRAELISGS